MTRTSPRHFSPPRQPAPESLLAFRVVYYFANYLVNLFQDDTYTGLTPLVFQYIDNQLIIKQLTPNPSVFKRVGSPPFHKCLISRPLKTAPPPTPKNSACNGSDKCCASTRAPAFAAMKESRSPVKPGMTREGHAGDDKRQTRNDVRASRADDSLI
jgi:hypothetical protein